MSLLETGLVFFAYSFKVLTAPNQNNQEAQELVVVPVPVEVVGETALLKFDKDEVPVHTQGTHQNDVQNDVHQAQPTTVPFCNIVHPQATLATHQGIVQPIIVPFANIVFPQATEATGVVQEILELVLLDVVHPEPLDELHPEFLAVLINVFIAPVQNNQDEDELHPELVLLDVVHPELLPVFTKLVEGVDEIEATEPAQVVLLLFVHPEPELDVDVPLVLLF